MNDNENDNAKQRTPGEDEQREAARSEAARLMGRSQTPAKVEAARLNGRKGGRPKGQSADEATRERMREAQRKRRQEEKERPLSKDDPCP